MMSTSQDGAKSRCKLAQLRHFISHISQLEIFQHGKEKADKIIIENILKGDFNINYRILNSCDSEILDYIGDRIKVCTALHMLAVKVPDIDVFNNLLERGADFTIQNDNGQTALHLLFDSKFLSNCFEDIGRSKTPFINSILSTHVKLKNVSNPRDDNGISHLHAACSANHVEAIKLFLDNGTSVNEAVNSRLIIRTNGTVIPHMAPDFAGYTPLHFAAEFDCFEAAQLLVNRGANINAPDAKGLSSIDLLTGRRLYELNGIRAVILHIRDENRKNTILKKISDNEKIIKLLLDKQCRSNVGLSPLQVASTLEDLSIVECLSKQVVDINYSVPMKSPVCPGFNAAHFAAINSVDAVKMLAMRGAHLNIEDANGLTPLNICVEKYSIQDIHDILSCVENWKNIFLSDGKTKLMDLVLSMRDLDQFSLFLQNNIQDLVVPNDSPLWPGSTILHLAVILSTKNQISYEKPYDESIIEECLERGLDINSKDSKGRTAVHLAFKLRKENIVRLFLEHLDELDEVMDQVDEDNLSYMHIACHTHRSKLLQRLLENSEPNVVYKGKRMQKASLEPGYTPLHIAVCKSANVVETLLMHSANLHATDAYGLTPIHWLLANDKAQSSNVQPVENMLFKSLSENPKDCVVDGLELSYLHVACVYGHLKVVEKLLDLGSNINAIVNFERTPLSLNSYLLDEPLQYLSKYSKFTPLHCALLKPQPQVIDVLLRRGADVFAEFSSSPDHCIFLEKVEVVKKFMPYLWENEDMQKCMETRLGMTKLHVACYMKDEEAVRSVLNEEIDVNAKIHTDSIIFSGCTPLHLLMTVPQSQDSRNHRPLPLSEFTIGAIIDLLLDHGADVTIRNAEGDTPIHVFYKLQQHFTDRNHFKSRLLKAHRDFNVDAINARGLSHFHVACFFHEVEVVEKFLQCGTVDINWPIDFFAEVSPGCTALHLALNHRMTHPNDDWTKLSQTVDLLLKHGANVAAKDVLGDTPLHKNAALIPEGVSILEKLISYGADVISENVKGETPLEKLSLTNYDDYKRIFEKAGYRMNSTNRMTGEGYIAKLFFSRNSNLIYNSEFNKWLQSSDLTAVDEMGRTVIHNSVALLHQRDNRDRNYISAIESYIKLGIDIDRQDKLGKTALHYAAQMENTPGVKALLKCGIDVNIPDNNGKPAYFYPMQLIMENFVDSIGVKKALYQHIQKLQRLRIEVSPSNRYLADHIKKLWRLDSRSKLPSKFSSEIETTKTLDIENTSMNLFDFLSETGAVSLYPFLLESTRNLIDDFFKSIDFKKFEELDGIIKLQFRKMKARLELIDEALTSLKTLLGFSFPGLCEEITRFLSNTDLKNLTASTRLGGENSN